MLWYAFLCLSNYLAYSIWYPIKLLFFPIPHLFNIKTGFMKRVFILLGILIISSEIIKAQGIYQLWGTTANGGNDNTGVMFSTDAIGNQFTSRHQFNSYNPGANPGYSELKEYNGKFYGMTQNGGSNDAGVIFEWDPSTNIYQNKYDFISLNGRNPRGSLTLNAGKFYGMTSSGGINDVGVIFEWDPTSNIYTKKNDLNASNGSNPHGKLTFHEGKFYGMTYAGGNNGTGVIFEWDPNINLYTKKIDLNSVNGNNPIGSLTVNEGKFYGITNKGGLTNYGVIFEWDPISNIYNKKIDFDWNNGRNSFGSLIFSDGKFYGMTRNGGINDRGVIFEWDPVLNICTGKQNFADNIGRFPTGNDLIKREGKFYGMTSGISQGIDPTVRGGGIFEWDPVSNVFTRMINLSDPTLGYLPFGNLTLKDSKFIGMTSSGGSNNSGVIFEWDPNTNIYSKKIDFNGNNGLNPSGALSLIGGKFYGVAKNGGWQSRGLIYEWDPSSDTIQNKIQLWAPSGGNPYGKLIISDNKFYGMTNSYGDAFGSGGGVIFEWDPTSNNYSRKIYSGGHPYGSLTLNDGKFYGMTNLGGISVAGEIFEWDPATNIFTKKIDLNSTTGSNPYGSLTLHDGKFYGLTYAGGINNAGVIFEWDPVTNIYSKKIDLNSTTGSNPYGSLTLSNGKFYGLTYAGGINNAGVIFEWDPTTNTYTKKFDFNIANGSKPQGSLILSNGKFYGLTSTGGNSNLGVMFEWDPVTNVYTTKKEFNGMDGGNPGISNDLSLLPAPVAKGMAGNCLNFPQVTIDNSNNNVWVPITDNKGDAVAEIKANGNNLGIVSSSVFINNAAVRENAVKRLYLDRNLTITPEFQPATPVDVRLYIKGSEYLALKNAVNSIGQSSGILSINDVIIFKNEDICERAISITTSPVQTAASGWQNDYVLSASISSFSSFYFLAQGGPLPLTLLEFNGKLQNSNGVVYWQTSDEYNTRSFELERSTDGRIFKPVANIAAINMPGNHKYNYTDKNITSLAVPVVYYRLKQIDIDGRFTYTRVITLNIDKDIIVMLYPNPVSDIANLTISSNKPQQVQARIVDNSGKVIIQYNWRLSPGNTSFTIDVSGFAKGIYFLELKGEMINERRKLVKN